jgi:hypothetical protein
MYSREYQVFTHNAFGSATLHAEKEMAPGGAGLGITWLPPSNAHSGLSCKSREGRKRKQRRAGHPGEHQVASARENKKRTWLIAAPAPMATTSQYIISQEPS